MRKVAVGLAALLAASFGAPAMAESVQDEIQDEEQPGSEFELEDTDGKVEFGRKGKLDAEQNAEDAEGGEGLPLEIGDEDAVPLESLDDPDNPSEIDPIDEELPGEGPEDLSGPDDEDPLPE
ncbi:MAG: hypothetical protein R3D01_03495 [Hyphomicrobiales bacterium]